MGAGAEKEEAVDSTHCQLRRKSQAVSCRVDAIEVTSGVSGAAGHPRGNRFGRNLKSNHYVAHPKLI